MIIYIQLDNTTDQRKEIEMYEIVKVVNGYEITRMKGTRSCYHVVIEKNDFFEKSCTFKTIKSAVQFIETAL